MKGGGSREPPPFHRRSSFLPLFFPIPCECPAGPIRRDIPIYKENFPFLPLYKLEKACYNIQAVKKHAPVAQWIEHRIPVPRVGGSSPFRRTKKADTQMGVCFFGISEEWTRKAGPGAAGVKNSPVDCFSGRGRVPPFPDASRKGCRWKRRTPTPQGLPLFCFPPEGTRKGGLSEAKARKCPVDTFLARGRVH